MGAWRTHAASKIAADPCTRIRSRFGVHMDQGLAAYAWQSRGNVLKTRGVSPATNWYDELARAVGDFDGVCDSEVPKPHSASRWRRVTSA
eukprot:6172628-Pleurochrysis_carterae.AAC.1